MTPNQPNTEAMRGLQAIRALVDEQAEDEGLWGVNLDGSQNIVEAYLQQELRRLHALIETVAQPPPPPSAYYSALEKSLHEAEAEREALTALLEDAKARLADSSSCPMTDQPNTDGKTAHMAPSRLASCGPSHSA